MNQTNVDEIMLIINAGSSSIKFSLYLCTTLSLLYHGEIEILSQQSILTVYDEHHLHVVKKTIPTTEHESALNSLFDWLKQLPSSLTLKAVGHRVVHGGTYFTRPSLISTDTIDKIASLIPLAPIHQPHNLAAITTIKTLYPTLLQIACFDTTFHLTQPRLATLFAIPQKLTAENIIRYGFHGLSYEYIASVLPNHLCNKADGKIIVAHLGHGASMCAMQKRKSIATSMGFTALDGLMMGTRCGTIDPGVILYLLQEKKLTIEQVNHLLYKESGLLGVSGISSDMRELQCNTDPNAIEAVELFCYTVVKELGALSALLQGVDAIVFTAGIGENSAIIRQKICEQLKWLGVVLDTKANANHASIISQDCSNIVVSVIPTNEEYMIAKHILKFL